MSKQYLKAKLDVVGRSRYFVECIGKTGNMKENAEVYLLGSGGGVVMVFQSLSCPLKVGVCSKVNLNITGYGMDALSI